MNLLLVAIGGAIGAGSRYLLGGWLKGYLGAGFPWSTFLINVSGSLAIGMALALTERGTFSPETSLFLTVGVLGGFTTFSTFSYETVQLLSRGHAGASLLNALGQFTLSMAAVYLGFALARLLR